MVTHLPARFPYIGYDAPGSSNNPKPHCDRNTLIRAVASLAPSCQLRVLRYPERCPKKETFWLRLRSLNGYQTSRRFRLSSGKYRMQPVRCITEAERRLVEPCLPGRHATGSPGGAVNDCVR